jgi:hypothetical protein
MTELLSYNTHNIHTNVNTNTNTNHKFCCVICNKEYTRKSSLDKHRILCDFKLKTKREHQIDSEELADIPNHIQLVKIVQELTLKLTKMEGKMEEMQKWINIKKKKLNVIMWLNSNVKPTIGFLEWVNTSLLVKSEHFENLMENSLFHTIQQVFEFNLAETTDFIYPIMCFSQKSSIFYICEKKEDDTPEWRQLQLADMVLMLRTVQSRMIKELTKWKLDNQYKFDDNDKIAELFNKTVIKLMNISFTQDANLSRIRNGLYNYLKTDLKTQIDYEFEF